MIIYYLLQTIELWIFVGILGLAIVAENIYNRLTGRA
jgi:hypothetical protein